MMHTCECGAKCPAPDGARVFCLCGRVTVASPANSVPLALPMAGERLPRKRPRWAKLVERWFRQPDDIGVGDSFEHMAEAFGADRVAKFVKRWGIDCGCGDRKAKWNRLYPYG